MSSYEFHLTLEELIKLWFYKKICPVCQTRLIKKVHDVLVKDGWHRAGTGLDFSYGKKYKREIMYHCPACDKAMHLTELRRQPK